MWKKLHYMEFEGNVKVGSTSQQAVYLSMPCWARETSHVHGVPKGPLLCWQFSEDCQGGGVVMIHLDVVHQRRSRLQILSNTSLEQQMPEIVGKPIM